MRADLAVIELHPARALDLQEEQRHRIVAPEQDFGVGQALGIDFGAGRR